MCVKTFAVDPLNGEPIVDDLPYELVPATPAHDVWSLGVVFYELFSGVQLFLANSGDNIQVFVVLCFSGGSAILTIALFLRRRNR